VERAWLLMCLTMSACGRGGDGDARALAAYDRYRQPDALVAALALAPGESVADVGAGRGYLTHRLARAVGPSGRVVATDVDARALAAIDARAGERIEKRVARADDPGLEAAGYDLILLAEVDHLLGDRADYFTRLRAALKPRGRLALSNRMLYRAPSLAAAARAGFTVERERDDLPGHYLLILEVAK
jgi:cyclopropane fatty-acyl-phospholipid synthase-like methyltransferase